MEIVIGALIIVGLAWLLIRGQNKKEAGVSTEQSVVNTPVVTEEVKSVVADTPVVETVPAKKTRKPRAPKAVAATKKPAAKKTTKSKKA